MEEIKTKQEIKEEKKMAAEKKKEEKEALKQAKREAKKSSGSKKGIIGIFVALIVAVLATVTLFMAERNILADYEKQTVVVVKENVVAGLDITIDNVNKYFELKELPVEMIPAEAYTEVEKIVGKFADVNMVAKEIPVESNFTEMEVELNIENPVETSFALAGTSQVVAGTLRRGDEISISVTNSNDSRLNGVVLENLLIKNAYSADGVQLNVGDSGQAVMFVVIMSQEDEQTLNMLLASGGNIRVAKTNHVQY